jgi:SAM-dependent methyltransferase
MTNRRARDVGDGRRHVRSHRLEAMNEPEPECDDREEQEERRLASRSLAAGDSTGWFDELYAAGVAGRVHIPWSRTDPHPLLTDWISARQLNGAGHHAIVVGCGLGADAEHVAALGFDTTAFDVSPTAIQLARRRHPVSSVRYVAADLLDPPADWLRAFDLVVEIITVQALPDPPRRQAIINVGRLVATAGTLLVIAWRHGNDRPPPPPPWPLRREEIDAFATDGLTPERVEALTVPGESGELRWRAQFRRDRPGRELSART